MGAFWAVGEANYSTGVRLLRCPLPAVSPWEQGQQAVTLKDRASACHHVFPTEVPFRTEFNWLQRQVEPEALYCCHCTAWTWAPKASELCLDIPNSLNILPFMNLTFHFSLPLALWDSLTVFACQIAMAGFEDGSNVRLSLPKESSYLLSDM